MQRCLLPAHLPPRTELVHQGFGEGRRSRRSRARWRVRRLSFELLEWQLAIFNCWELGCPHAPAEWVAALGPWMITPLQWASSEELRTANSRMGRLYADVSVSTSGRGQATLQEQLTEFEGAWTSHTDKL